MAQNHIITPIYRYSLFLTLLICSAAIAQAQSGGGIDNTGTGGRHAISGRLIFPSGQRLDYQVKVKLETSGEGDLTVFSDINGNFSFRSLTAGNYTVVIDGGDNFEPVRESVFIEPYNTSPAPGVRLVPVSRPINLQIYLRPKQTATRTRPGVVNAALASVPKAAVALYDKGLEFVSQNERDKAIDQFRRAVELHPEFGLALNELGAQYMKKGDLEKAEEALTKAFRLVPDSPDVALNYGILLLQKKKFADAEVQLRDAVKKNESAYTAHLYFGITLIYVKKFEEAETELQKAVTLGREKASQAHYYLGGLYWQTGKNRQAADELEKFLKLEPKAPNAEKLRGTIKELRNKSE